MSSEAMNFVRSIISENIVAVFSKTYCPYCAKAKSALSQFPIKSIKIVELDNRNDGNDIQDALQQLTGGRSVPRVFIGQQFIGGGDDTVALARSGELQKKLQQAGAL